MPKEPIPFPDDIHRAFARRVRALRIERELSQAHLASRVTSFGVPIDRTAVARIEQAAIESESKLKPRKVTIDEAYGFAVALGVPLDVLLPYDESAFDYAEPVTRKHFDKSVKELRRSVEVQRLLLQELKDTVLLELHKLGKGSEVKQ